MKHWQMAAPSVARKKCLYTASSRDALENTSPRPSTAVYGSIHSPKSFLLILWGADTFFSFLSKLGNLDQIPKFAGQIYLSAPLSLTFKILIKIILQIIWKGPVCRLSISFPHISLIRLARLLSRACGWSFPAEKDSLSPQCSFPTLSPVPRPGFLSFQHFHILAPLPAPPALQEYPHTLISSYPHILKSSYEDFS